MKSKSLLELLKSTLRIALLKFETPIALLKLVFLIVALFGVYLISINHFEESKLFKAFLYINQILLWLFSLIAIIALRRIFLKSDFELKHPNNYIYPDSNGRNFRYKCSLNASDKFRLATTEDLQKISDIDRKAGTWLFRKLSVDIKERKKNMMII